MKNDFKQIYDFIRAFNFCFGLMLLVFAASLFLTIYMNNFWYLLLAVLDVAFYFAFYFVFTLLLNYFSEIDELETQNNDIENIKEQLKRLTSKPKEQEIDFFKVNQNK